MKRKISDQTELLLTVETPWTSVELNWPVWSRVRALGNLFDRGSNTHILIYRTPLTNLKIKIKFWGFFIFLIFTLLKYYKSGKNISNSLNFRCLKKWKMSCFAFKISYPLKIKMEKIMVYCSVLFWKTDCFSSFYKSKILVNF